jgi:hypothetical protein
MDIEERRFAMSKPLRRANALLSGTLARHGESMSPKVSRHIAAAADEILDPLVLPDLLHPDDPDLDDPIAALDKATAILVAALGDLDLHGSLAAGRALRELRAARAAWSVP